MILKFKELSLEELAADKQLLGKQKFPAEVIKLYKKRIFQMKRANSTQEIREIKGLHFEKLKEKRYDGKYSIKINDGYRLIFEIDKQGSFEILLIEEISKHYS